MVSLGVIALLAGFGVGCYLLVTHEPKPKPSTEMTEKDVKLYRSAAVILSRLVNIVDIQGVMSDDMVSTTTRKQIDEWLANYKKALNKK